MPVQFNLNPASAHNGIKPANSVFLSPAGSLQRRPQPHSSSLSTSHSSRRTFPPRTSGKMLKHAVVWLSLRLHRSCLLQPLISASSFFTPAFAADIHSTLLHLPRESAPVSFVLPQHTSLSRSLFSSSHTSALEPHTPIPPPPSCLQDRQSALSVPNRQNQLTELTGSTPAPTCPCSSRR